MGYYSEVTITMKEEDCINLFSNLYVPGAANEARNIMRSADDILVKEMSGGSPVVTFRWSYIKWYDNNPGVAFIMNYLNGVPHRYVRMGEDFGDIDDELSEDDYDLDLVTPVQYIDIDGVGSPIDIDELLSRNTQPERVNTPAEDSINNILGA